MVIVFKILVGFLEQKNLKYRYLLLNQVLLKVLNYKIYVNDAQWKPYTVLSHLSANLSPKHYNTMLSLGLVVLY